MEAQITVDGMDVLASGTIVGNRPETVEIALGRNNDRLVFTLKFEFEPTGRPQLRYKTSPLKSATLRAINISSPIGSGPDQLLDVGELDGRRVLAAFVISAPDPRSAVRVDYTFYFAPQTRFE
jgi:hypothetical protein